MSGYIHRVLEINRGKNRMKSDIFIENKVFKQNIDYALGRHKLIFLSAIVGSGKTVAVQNWLHSYSGSYRMINFPDKDSFLIQIGKITGDSEPIIYLIPNIERLHGDRDCLELLADCIRKSGEQSRFMISSRAPMPEQLKCFIATKEGRLFEKELLRFSREMTAEFLVLCGIDAEKEIVERIHHFTRGYPTLLVILSNYLAQGSEYNEELEYRAKLDMASYVETEVFSGLCEEDKRFMMKLSLIKREQRLFSRDVLCAAVGTEDISETLYRICSSGRFLMERENEKYRIIKLFHFYLSSRREKYLSKEEIKAGNERLAAFYESQDNIIHAIYYYKQADNLEKVEQLLIRNIREKATGAAQYYELASYYLEIPEEIVLKSPALLSALSILHSLLCDVEKSEYYFAKLEQMYKNCSKGSDLYFEILRCRIIVLISMPHSGTINMVKYILEAARYKKEYHFTLPPMSITGNMPSMMNGGKDFCNWARHDKFLYSIMAGPLGQALGKQEQGVPEIGMGESAYEKNRLEEAFNWLSSGIAKAEVGGMIEVYFAGQGVVLRLLMAQGRQEEALRLAEKLEKRLIKQRAEHLLPNLRAVYIRILMLTGKSLEKSRWLANEAPDEVEEFRITERYRYMTKARVLISEEEYYEAIGLIDKMYSYADNYNRPYIMMEAMLLKAITLYRMNNEDYLSVFNALIKKTKSHGYIRIIADSGAAAWDLMKDWKPEDAYEKELKSATEKQMLLYPDYMKKEKRERIALSDYELSVLRFLENGMSNTDIAEVMSISIHTVKYHLGNIYQKLDVKNRTMAIKTAREYELI